MLLISVSCDESCPTWLHPSGDGECVCDSLRNAVVCKNECKNETKVSVLNIYCLTSNGDGSNTSVVGTCLAAVNHGMYIQFGLYNRVLKNLLDQEEQTCGYLNRQGRLCGECKPNHSISAYTYDIKCYPCTSSVWKAVVEYVCIAYLPLTIFLCTVILFRISVTSPAMNVPVLCCQILSSPASLIYFLQLTRGTHNLYYIKFLSTVYGIWNLDFFRSLTPPICLPLNTMQMMALDYLVAAYPLFLLTCFYALLRAYDRGCRLVMRLWRPFLWCTARLRQQWNIRRSIIDAFATFLLLSYVKLINVSHILLIPTSVRNSTGSWIGDFLFYDATVEYVGPEHRPYAVLAILILVVGVLFPLILLLLYPMQCFQKCLNRCGLNSPGLQMFMQCFQGYYRDRTDGGRECRYFAAVYPAFRIATFVMYSIAPNISFCFAFPLFCVIVTVSLVFVSPYKQQYQKYNKVDFVMVLSLGIVINAYLFHFTTYLKHPYSYIAYIVFLIFSLSPLVYFTVRLSLSMKRVLVQKLSICWHHVSSTGLREDYEDLNSITLAN